MTRRLRTPLLLLLAAGLAYLLAPGSAMGAFTRTITNSTDTAAVNFTCKSSAVAAGAYFAYPLDESAGIVAADASGAGHPGTYTLLGVTYGSSGPCPRDGAKAVTLDGATGYLYSNATVSNPQTFTEQVWFNTSTTSGGKLIGFGNNNLTPSSVDDRHIYMTSGTSTTAGKLIFGVYPAGSTRTIQSTASYNDGKWHLATATLAPSGAQVGMRLYVDGALVASDPATTSAEPIASGYWRVGYDNLNGWPSAPTSGFFQGKVAYAEVYATALTAAQVQGQYTVGAS